ncbi:hypothetical protein DdX_17456 [Ditylenchus destructor]|uniref:Uncharacterized protein n=1 Tax=Ditylenchus destructor TaxID=166010 RepID=A0AAD4QYZ6_9BILA|nr:hypothetical protein DdX_17456 [Ditylenchus destructor]
MFQKVVALSIVLFALLLASGIDAKSFSKQEKQYVIDLSGFNIECNRDEQCKSVFYFKDGHCKADRIIGIIHKSKCEYELNLKCFIFGFLLPVFLILGACGWFLWKQRDFLTPKCLRRL